MSRRRDRMLVAERVVASITGPDGRWSNRDAIALLGDEYRADPGLLDPDAQARSDIEALDKARRPDASAPTLFDKDAWLPLGEANRVRMGDAQLDDLDAWSLVELEAHARHIAAYQRTAAYILSRRQAWTATDTCLLDVEQRLAP